MKITENVSELTHAEADAEPYFKNWLPGATKQLLTNLTSLILQKIQ